MAAVCQLMNKETGKKTWHYAVDAKEILAMPDCLYKLTGETKLNGTATPSIPVERRAAAAKAAQKDEYDLMAEAVERGVRAATEFDEETEPETEDLEPEDHDDFADAPEESLEADEPEAEEADEPEIVEDADGFDENF